jgi:FkbM family methyltransferase
MNNNLIFDIGANTGQDTAYYLSKGYRVIAVDASPDMIRQIKQQLAAYVESGQLELLNYAISEQDGEVLNFYLSENTDWHSLDKNISNRDGKLVDTIQVESITLSRLVEKYGIPHYCKIDIEGYDTVALTSLETVQAIPQYISVESECLDDGNPNIPEEEILKTLNHLRRLGYQKFKLVDQVTLKVLPHRSPFYSKTYAPTLLNKALIKTNVVIPPHKYRTHINNQNNYDFPAGGTGPFGAQLEGKWLTYEQAKETILFHRKDFFATKERKGYDFWCDWHATT